MKIYIIIPAYNEEAYIGQMIESLVSQTVLPTKAVIVDDNSSDKTYDIAEKHAMNHEWLTVIRHESSNEHIPGGKVINAFNRGKDSLDGEYDVICKFDADIILPNNYLEELITLFESDSKTGIAGGLLYIQKNNEWVYESIASKEHVRGPIKAYRKQCIQDIEGLKDSIGWDTADVLLAQFHGWLVRTNKNLHVKHLKPTGKTYTAKSKYLQG
ncbi:MAG: glycosyltransferase family 2 protein, partial [Bacteroidia bacterium]|nr:glycosyltransferase family 2 protein [Bacteroidia bacterium]